MSNSFAPERRRTIVVLDSGEHRRILRDPERVDLIDDPETQFVSFPDGDSTQAASVDMLRSQDLFRPGMLAIQSPYDTERYVAAEGAITEFTVEKFLALTRLAKLLGAKRVVFEDVRADRNQSSSKAGAKARNLAVSGESTVSRSIEADLRHRLKGEHVFAGGAPDLQGARRLLSSLRLAGDPQIVALIELRTGDNPIKRQEIHFSGTRESGGNITAALRVAGGPGRLKLAAFSSDLAHQWESKIQVDVRTIVEF